jgi:hypothetical protein
VKFLGERDEVFIEGEVAEEAMAVFAGEGGERGSWARRDHVEEHTTRRGRCKGGRGDDHICADETWSLLQTVGFGAGIPGVNHMPMQSQGHASELS